LIKAIVKKREGRRTPGEKRRIEQKQKPNMHSSKVLKKPKASGSE